MDWLLFTYWLPLEPSRKRVFVWRQLKRLGAISLQGGGWVLPRKEPLSARKAELANTVEEMGGTANLFTVTHLSDEQEKRTINMFQREREQEYAEITQECHKALGHIKRETLAKQFNLGEVEELEVDLGKINHWFSHIKARDFWESNARKEVERLIKEVESSLAAFTQKTYEKLQSTEQDGQQ